jgi:cytosine/adenosine deaminase-related metal-dependent hydrolase
MIDLLITGGIVVTMDRARRVLEDGAVAIDGARIVDVGMSAEIGARWPAKRVIDARRKIVLPGLVDAHGHGGHGLLKTIASDTPSLWGRVVTAVYFHFTTPEFWYAEGRLSALERLRFGVTTGLCVIGSEPRSDDPELAGSHARAYAELGLREIVAVGPCNPPFPRPASRWRDGHRTRADFTFDQAIAGMEQVVERWHGAADGRIQVHLTPFVIVPSLDSSGPTPADRAVALSVFDLEMTRRVREIARHHGLRIHSDALGGMVRLAADDPNGLLGPDVLMQHCTGISLEEVAILARTDTRIGHAPMSGMLLRGRCPAIELLEAGATVAITTDGTSPRTSFDLFPAMRAAIRLHQLHFRDASVLPPGKALEMVTIDAARAIGLENQIGSLETGKRADVILIDGDQAHLAPLRMPVHRLVFEASGQDVATVIVDGRVLMEDRRVLCVDARAVIDSAEREAAAVIARAGLEPFIEPPANFWSCAHARIDDDRADRIPV